MDVPKGLENHGIDKLRKAVQAMRDACDEADRADNWIEFFAEHRKMLHKKVARLRR